MSITTTVRSLAARAVMSEDDVRALLLKDHVEALDLAKRMHETEKASVRKSLLAKLKPALTAHSRAEEKVVYDALLKVRSKDTHAYGNEGYVEHSLVDALLTRLSRGDAAKPIWQAEAKVLFENLHHHIAEEQSDVFSALGEHFDSEQLQAMGASFLKRKATILRTLAKKA